VIAAESVSVPAGIPAIILSTDLSLILGSGEPTPLTSESLARLLLKII
jgi:hypothetical protein